MSLTIIVCVVARVETYFVRYYCMYMLKKKNVHVFYRQPVYKH